MGQLVPHTLFTCKQGSSSERIRVHHQLVLLPVKPLTLTFDSP